MRTVERLPGFEPRTHDFSRRMTGGCRIWSVHEKGRRLRLYGWARDDLAAGDYVILGHQSGETARYRLTLVERPGDPPDMYFANAEFDPA